MNRLNTLLLACTLFLLMTSCSQELEKHELTPIESSIVLNADQTLDSLSFYTYDSWKVTPQVDWISIYGKTYADVVNDFTKYLWTVYASVKPNTSGETREGSVLVQSHDFSYSFPVIQLGLLCITHPVYTVDSWYDEHSRIPQVAHYELSGSANWTSDSICFTVENDWNLALVDEVPTGWLTFDKNWGLAGEHCRVNLSFTANKDKDNERRATLRLTSGKVSNTITVRQSPAPK